MPMNRTPIEQTGSLQDQVARNIRNDIEAGVLRDGETLPSTRQMAEQWGVSVFTVNEAMKLLAEEGLVVSKSRSGRVIRAPRSGGRAALRIAKPQVVLVGGYAGSGKSELARILARESGWGVLDKDTMTRPLVESLLEVRGLPPHDRESTTYVQDVRPREYDALMASVWENLECGVSAIAAAPFIQEFQDAAWVERTTAKAEALGVALSLVWLSCDADTMLTYIRHRGAARDAAKLADWAGYLDGLDLEFRPAAPHVVVENSASSEPLQSQAKSLLESLAERPQG
jgi:DNA-binding transcriptional regulator YhcF (GntR family)